jgi:hypothetical protein
MNELDFIGGFVGDDVSPLEAAQIASARQDAAEVRQEAQAQAERAAQAQDRADALQFAERAHGHPLAELSRARNVLLAADDEYRDAAAAFRKAEVKRARAASNVEFFAQRAAQVQEVAQRSAGPSGDPLEQAQRAAHRAYISATRARMSDAALGRAPKGRRPFAGVAVRAEGVVCEHCVTMGATPEESFLIHHTDANGNLVAAAAEPEPAEEHRSFGASTPMIYR